MRPSYIWGDKIADTYCNIVWISSTKKKNGAETPFSPSEKSHPCLERVSKGEILQDFQAHISFFFLCKGVALRKTFKTEEKNLHKQTK